MTVRIQVLLDEEEAARFRAQAASESKSLSAWLRDAGRKKMEAALQQPPLSRPDALRKFFEECDQREHGLEPEWESHKKMILEGHKGASVP